MKYNSCTKGLVERVVQPLLLSVTCPECPHVSTVTRTTILFTSINKTSNELMRNTLVGYCAIWLKRNVIVDNGGTHANLIVSPSPYILYLQLYLVETFSVLMLHIGLNPSKHKNMMNTTTHGTSRTYNG